MLFSYKINKFLHSMNLYSEFNSMKRTLAWVVNIIYQIMSPFHVEKRISKVDQIKYL